MSVRETNFSFSNSSFLPSLSSLIRTSSSFLTEESRGRESRHREGEKLLTPSHLFHCPSHFFSFSSQIGESRKGAGHCLPVLSHYRVRKKSWNPKSKPRKKNGVFLLTQITLLRVFRWDRVEMRERRWRRRDTGQRQRQQGLLQALQHKSTTPKHREREQKVVGKGMLLCKERRELKRANNQLKSNETKQECR